MKQRAIIIAFEGMPGAGKTTAIKNLVKILGKRAIVLPQINLPISWSDGLQTSKRYLDAEIRKATAIRELSNRCQYLLIDRTFLTTLAYAYARSRQNDNPVPYRKVVQYFRNLDKKHHFPRPTKIVLFFLKTRKSLERRARYTTVKAFKRWFSPEFLKYFAAFYQRHYTKFEMPPPIIIDTTNMAPNEIITELRKYL